MEDHYLVDCPFAIIDLLKKTQTQHENWWLYVSQRERESQPADWSGLVLLLLRRKDNSRQFQWVLESHSGTNLTPTWNECSPVHNPYMKVSVEGAARSERPDLCEKLPCRDQRRACVNSTESIPGSVRSLRPTEFINQEKGKTSSPEGQKFLDLQPQKLPWSGHPCLPPLLSCSFVFQWMVW